MRDGGAFAIADVGGGGAFAAVESADGGAYALILETERAARIEFRAERFEVGEKSFQPLLTPLEKILQLAFAALRDSATD